MGRAVPTGTPQPTDPGASALAPAAGFPACAAQSLPHCPPKSPNSASSAGKGGAAGLQSGGEMETRGDGPRAPPALLQRAGGHTHLPGGPVSAVAAQMSQQLPTWSPRRPDQPAGGRAQRQLTARARAPAAPAAQRPPRGAPGPRAAEPRGPSAAPSWMELGGNLGSPARPSASPSRARCSVRLCLLLHLSGSCFWGEIVSWSVPQTFPGFSKTAKIPPSLYSTRGFPSSCVCMQKHAPMYL